MSDLFNVNENVVATGIKLGIETLNSLSWCGITINPALLDEFYEYIGSFPIERLAVGDVPTFAEWRAEKAAREEGKQNENDTSVRAD